MNRSSVDQPSSSRTWAADNLLVAGYLTFCVLSKAEKKLIKKEEKDQSKSDTW